MSETTPEVIEQLLDRLSHAPKGSPRLRSSRPASSTGDSSYARGASDYLRPGCKAWVVLPG